MLKKVKKGRPATPIHIMKKAVGFVKEGYSKKSVCEKFGITPPTLRNWINKLEAQNEDSNL